MIVAEVCGRINESSGYHMVCEDFFNAVRKGEMVADTVRGGWVCKTIPLREMSSSAKWFGLKRIAANHSSTIRESRIC